MRIFDRVANVDDAAEQFAELNGVVNPAPRRKRVKLANGLLQAVAADKTHGVVGPAIGIFSEAIDGHDSGMFEAAGNLRFEHEARAAVGVVVAVEFNLLESYLAIQLEVFGDEDLAQAPRGMRPQDAEAHVVQWRRIDR